MATSESMLTKMIRDLKASSKKIGLELHMGKTKVLTNIPDEERTPGPFTLLVGEKTVEILRLED